ncbi:MAG: hypothetical protein WBC51_03720 [Vicinamibacterales bacterium]
MNDDVRSPGMPDHYDRLLGALDGLPGVLSTKPAIAQQLTPILGTSQTFVIRTVRQQERDEQQDIAPPGRLHRISGAHLARTGIDPTGTATEGHRPDRAPTRSADHASTQADRETSRPGTESTRRSPGIRASETPEVTSSKDATAPQRQEHTP